MLVMAVIIPKMAEFLEIKGWLASSLQVWSAPL
jgi:hypothetical protein